MGLSDPNRSRNPCQRTQADLRREAENFADQFSRGEPGYGRPSDFLWSYDSAFPLLRIGGDSEDLVKWAAEERVAWIESFGDERGLELSECWLSNPEDRPIVVVVGTDGRIYVWDGNHRIGAALAAGRFAVPAIVGRRRKHR